jgi:hypothetical protein
MTCTQRNLSQGTVSHNIVFETNPAYSGTLTNEASITTTGGIIDYKPGNNAATSVAVVQTSTSPVCPTPVFINEFHYDNVGADQGEFVEVFGPAGTDLSGWSIMLYNGDNGLSYKTISLGGIIDNEGSGHGAVAFFEDGIENGAPDGFALFNAGDELQQFLSYEGSFTATGGPAAGQTSHDVGVSESDSTPVGQSLQLTGGGNCPPDASALKALAWAGPAAQSPGDLNTGQSPTAIELASFSASAAPEGSAILLTWETASEVDNLGFNVYRAQSPQGERARLNAALIPSLNPGSPTGAVYTWLDESAQPGVTYLYWLEAVDVHGGTTFHGPVTAELNPLRRLLPARPRPAPDPLGLRNR